jgi:hypothetical protein
MEPLNNSHPFAQMGKRRYGLGDPSVAASAEWEHVHTAAEATAWHKKWTPWFDDTAIAGLIKYAYNKQPK